MQAFSLVGYIGGVFMLLFCVGIADYCISVLLSLSAATERYTYEGIATTAFGRPGVVLVSACVIVLNLGALTAYQIIIGDVLPPLIVGDPTSLLTPSHTCPSLCNPAMRRPMGASLAR